MYNTKMEWKKPRSKSRTVAMWQHKRLRGKRCCGTVAAAVSQNERKNMFTAIIKMPEGTLARRSCCSGVLLLLLLFQHSIDFVVAILIGRLLRIVVAFLSYFQYCCCQFIFALVRVATEMCYWCCCCCWATYCCCSYLVAMRL